VRLFLLSLEPTALSPAQPCPVPGEKIPLVRPTNRYKGKSGNPPVLNSGEGGSEGSLNYQWKNDTRSSWLVFPFI